MTARRLETLATMTRGGMRRVAWGAGGAAALAVRRIPAVSAASTSAEAPAWAARVRVAAAVRVAALATRGSEVLPGSVVKVEPRPIRA